MLAVLVAMAAGCGGSTPDRSPVVLAVTTSTQDSGLLDALVPAFERRSGLTVKPIAVGSGQALAMAARGEVDVVLAHSPVAERRLMGSGEARSRRPVMRNEFVLVGPAADPAGVRGADVPSALRRIARHGATFVSRGDDSGTHASELAAWKRAGVAPRPPWHQETGQGQGATLQVAAERGGYALTDTATYLTSGVASALPVVVADGVGLHNPYHVIDMTRRAGPRVNAEGGRKLADWLVSAEAQTIIGDFGREEFGRPLFVPDAPGSQRARDERGS
jgi:tungstate transport system substrate-binding protein